MTKSRAGTRHLTVFSVKLTYLAMLRYREAAEEGAIEIGAFVL